MTKEQFVNKIVNFIHKELRPYDVWTVENPVTGKLAIQVDLNEKQTFYLDVKETL